VFGIILFMLEREEGVFTPDHVGIRSNSQVCHLYPSYGLSFQTETSEEKFSGLKKAGVIGLEFVGSCLFTSYYAGVYFLILDELLHQDWAYRYGGWGIFLLSVPVISAGTVWVIGKGCEREGSFWKSLVGGAIGSLLGGALSYPWDQSCLLPVLFSSLGAVKGYNLPKDTSKTTE